jgi:hypothetical protein
VWGGFVSHASTWKPRHITFELEWQEGAPLAWDEVKRIALEDIGCTGGALVVHPWRIKREMQIEWEDQITRGRTTQNRYEWTREHYGMSGFSWSPHCHGAVYGKFSDVRGSGSYRYRNLSEDTREKRIGSLHALEGILTYLFTHTFAPMGHEKTFRYFGICSVQLLKPEWSGSVTETMICEHCGKMMLFEGTNETVLHKHYIALGWKIFKKKAGP